MATSTPSKGNIDDLTVCPICYEVYVSPKSLMSCLHTFCKSCITSYARTTKKGSETESYDFNCPVCRTFYAVNDLEKWVNDLPSNHAITSLIDNKNMGTSEDGNCDSCLRREQSNKATSWCPECCDHLCHTCLDFHRSHRLSMNHKIVDITDKQTGAENYFCDKHLDRKLEVYCFDHETPCCLMCATVTHRKCECVSSLEECASEMNTEEEVSTIQKTYENLQKETKTALEIVKSDKESFFSQASDIRKQIKRLSEKAIHHLKEKELLILQDLSAIEKECETTFSEQCSDLAAKNSLATKALSLLEKLAKIPKIQIFLEVKRLQADSKTLQSSVNNQKERYEKHELIMKVDNRLTGFTSTISAFGSLQLQKVQDQAKIDFLTANLYFVKAVTKDGCRFTDVELIDDNHLITVCDSSSSLYLFNLDGTLLESLTLSGIPWSITAIQKYQVAISIRSASGIDIINICNNRSPKLRMDKSIKLSFNPKALSHYENSFYIASDSAIYSASFNGNCLNEQIIVNCKGNHKNTICVLSSDDIMFAIEPEHKVCHFKGNDSNIHEIKHSELHYPTGIARDPNGNIYVASYSKNSLLQLKPDTTFVRTLLKNDNEMTCPIGIRFVFCEDKWNILITCKAEIRIYRFDT